MHTFMTPHQYCSKAFQAFGLTVAGLPNAEGVAITNVGLNVGGKSAMAIGFVDSDWLVVTNSSIIGVSCALSCHIDVSRWDERLFRLLSQQMAAHNCC